MMIAKVREGYKQTEVGVIPEDWEVEKLGDGIKLLSGHHVIARYCNTEGIGIPYLTGPADFQQGNIQHTKFTENPSTLCRRDDILVTVKGSGAGKMVLADSEYCISRQLMAVRVIDWDVLFLFSLLKQDESLFGAAAIGLIPGLSRLDILNKFIPLPQTIAEQTAIATALSDTDALITSLEKLIEKKRAIKQGAMQELLKPKEGWVVKRLGEVGEIITGSTPPTQNREYWNGTIPWITPTDISDRKNIYHSEREISPLGLNEIRRLPANTLLVTCIASIGKNAILRVNGACNQQINAIVPHEDVDVDFLYYLIENNKQYLLGNAGITATLIISKKDFSEIVFPFPKDRAIQTSIASIFSDMDNEILTLEQKLSKYKLLKQGMMQELLTGKTRLI
jgi:type I restriction enzyme, S subunit